MGKKQLRKKVSQKLKELKIPYKLYNGNKKVAWEYWNSSRLREVLRVLSYNKENTIVHDCDGFNHIVVGLSYPPEYYQYKFVKIAYIDLQLKFEDGGTSCGCSFHTEPRSPKQIEEYFFDFILNHPWPKATILANTNEGKYYKKILEALTSGKHITDERGVLLPHYR